MPRITNAEKRLFMLSFIEDMQQLFPKLRPHDESDVNLNNIDEKHEGCEYVYGSGWPHLKVGPWWYLNCRKIYIGSVMEIYIERYNYNIYGKKAGENHRGYNFRETCWIYKKENSAPDYYVSGDFCYSYYISKK